MAETKPKGNDFYQRLLNVFAGLGYLQKDKKNEHQKYRYLSESKIKEEVRNLFVANRIYFNYSSDEVSTYEISPTSSGTRQFVTTVKGTWKMVDADNPDHKEDGRWIGTGTDTGDKGLYKAITGGIKYVLNTNFLIPSGDDPEKDDEVPSTPISPAQVKQIMELLTKKNVKQAWFAEFGIESRDNIMAGKKSNGTIITEGEGTAIIQAMLKLEDKKTTPPVAA